MTIRLLTEDTIGKIAAGEVVERPVSVVKELIENAVDAGATRIDVDIAGGGSERIRVSDNGLGMTRSDLELAIQRHATSKLSTFNDLETLSTLGFRGEALPSIGAVSHFMIRTAAAGEARGAQLVSAFGRKAEVAVVAARQGTVVTVEDLFGNVPARRKFLRQPGTEATYISRLVSAYAANWSDIAWSLTSEARRSISTQGNGDDIQAAIGIYGTELVDAVLPLSSDAEGARVEGIEVSGWILAPRVSRSHRQNLFFFVNGRLIQHRSLVYALEEAYHSLLMVGRHPVGMVRIDLDPRAVDVNVHPTKAEVRFADERAVARAVQRAAHAALTMQQQDVLPEVAYECPQGPPSVRQTFFEHQQQAPQPGGATFARRRADEDDEPDQAPSPGLQHRSGVPALRVLGQVGGAYIIAEGPGGIFLIDQHAAHERVMYEKILGQVETKDIDRQPLLDPLVVDLAPHELTVLERSMDELREIGFDLEMFGEQSVIVRSVPAVMQRVDIRERIHLILEELAEGGSGDSWFDSVAISAACHTSIRAGQALSLDEMRELVAQLERTRQPRACGHGRPTMLHMSQADLEKQFSRR
ncbi:MAG TPA: DNA mismatch repair endonuclease MutL [Thermomicrobiales bacterium]|nr:DNA mismatch repair endonuclease MutL [Thermomicrobiales bacterium]